MIPHWKQKFALLWTGQALSILSSMISQYALIWYLTDLTGSPAVLSLATMAALVPQGILSLFTGTFADRFDRRWIMIISDGAIGLVSLMLAAAAFAAPLPVAPILAVAALRSVGGAFHAPCIQAVTPLLAPPDALTRCAGWSQVWGDRIFEKCGIRRDEGGDGGKTLEIRGKRRLPARDGGANYQQS